MLVVDDEAKVRLGMKELLEGLGCRVSDVDSTAQAVKCAQMNPPVTFVLADFRLRGADHGIATVHAIREIYPLMPALLINGDTAPERLREANAAGITLLHKPISVKVLMRAIAVAVGRDVKHMPGNRWPACVRCLLFGHLVLYRERFAKRCDRFD